MTSSDFVEQDTSPPDGSFDVGAYVKELNSLIHNLGQLGILSKTDMRKAYGRIEKWGRTNAHHQLTYTK